MKRFFKQMLAMVMCFTAVSFIACSEDTTEPTPTPGPGGTPESYYQINDEDAVELKSSVVLAEGNNFRIFFSTVEGLTTMEEIMQFDDNGNIVNPYLMVQIAGALNGKDVDLTATEDAWDYYQVTTNFIEGGLNVNMYDESQITAGTMNVTIDAEGKTTVDLDITLTDNTKFVVVGKAQYQSSIDEGYEYYISFDGEEQEVKSVYMEQTDDVLLIMFSAEEGLETYDDFVEWAPGTTSYMHEIMVINMPVSAINTEVDLSNPEETSVWSNFGCFENNIDIKPSNELQPIANGGLFVLEGDGPNEWITNIYFELSNESVFEACCVGECEITAGGGGGDSEGQYGYVEYQGTKTGFKSAAFIFNETELGIQYAVAFSPEEGLTSFEDIMYAEESVYFSIDGETLYTAESETEGIIDVMTIGETNELYMFMACIGEDLWVEDMGWYHEDITSGEVYFVINPDTFDATLEAVYVTADGEEVKVSATAPYVSNEPAMLEDNFIRWFWGEYTPGDKEVVTAFAEESADGVTYTLCVGDIRTFADLADTSYFQFFVPGKKIGDAFTIEIQNTDLDFNCRLYDPVEEMDWQISKDNRANTIGTLSMNGWNIACDFTYTDPDGNTFNDIVMMADYKKQDFRNVNECIEVVEGERTLAFNPKSVVYDKSGSTHKVYISSAPGISTVLGMGEAEVVITYPATAYETIAAGNFISGSNCPEMTITIDGETYTKTTEGINGLNLVVPAFTADTIELNTNLYTSDGGMALYYTGKCTYIE